MRQNQAMDIFSASISLSAILIPVSLPTSPTPAMAQAQTSPQAALERLFAAPTLQREWFTEEFLSQIPVPPEQVIHDLQTNLGAFRSVEPAGESYRVVFERGSLSALIVLNASGQITGLLFQDIRPNAIALSDAIEQLRALPGQVNLLVTETKGAATADLAALNADQPLAIGSTFKLAILAALRQEIAAGRHSWDEVVALQPQDRSLPSGFLQTWFDGALLTIETLATLMISQSDNTATDALIHLMGREPIEALIPRNRPLLTTRELFVLKAAANAELLSQYRSGSEAQRRQLLPELAEAPLPSAIEFTERPVALDVEWFLTPREACGLMNQVADLPLMSVNPGGGLVSPADWARIAFKGGSEPGVLNLTTELVSHQGTHYCVSATWNNPEAALDENQFFTLYSSMIAGLQSANDNPTP
jgi:beta-lactamase class A